MFLVINNFATVRDSGESRISRGGGGCSNPKGGETPTYYLINFSWKLHENKEILAERGDARPWHLLRSATT